MSGKNGSGARKPDVEALRTEIAQTRADLGETVQALAAKADVKARAKDQVEQTKQKVKAQAAEATQKAREAAHTASGKVRTATERARGTTAQATDKARGSALHATDKVKESGVLEKAQGAGTRVRRPLPLTVVLTGAAALVGVILILRGRRR